jgi:toxin ParE1/3/4
MPGFRFSKLARLDLIDISNYTLDRWGVDQAIRYLDSLEKCFGLIAANPNIGRKCDHLRKGYRRIEHEKHVIFYRSDKTGILIVRILHQRILPEAKAMDDQE